MEANVGGLRNLHRLSESTCPLKSTQADALANDANPVSAAGVPLNSELLPAERLESGLLKGTANVTRIAVWEIGPLDHEDIGEPLGGIDPGLGAPGAAMAKRTWRKH